MFCFDIETLSVESTAVILSAAILHVNDSSELDKDNTKAYYQLLDSTLVVKFNASEQIKDGRHVTKSVVDWWSKQVDIAKEMSFFPSNKDQSVAEGTRVIREWFNQFPKNQPVWVRGSLDQPAYDSLIRQYKLPELVSYNYFRDVRTAIELMYPDSQGGYIEVPGFDTANVIKHMPNHDVAYDMLMLLRGEQPAF